MPCVFSEGSPPWLGHSANVSKLYVISTISVQLPAAGLTQADPVHVLASESLAQNLREVSMKIS